MEKFIRLTSMILLILLGISAMFGGGSFIIDPSGKLIQMPISHLQHTPFTTFLIPGLILFLFNGVSSIIIAVLVIKKNKYSSQLVFLQGAVQAIWIVVQVIILRQAGVLHYICFTVGLILLLEGLYLHNIKPKTK